jgi:hypothetical protein
MVKMFNNTRQPLNAKQKINIVFGAFGSIKRFDRQILGPS